MNNDFGISDKSFTLILNAFLEFNDIEYAAIFGSRAKGEFKKGSDIDIAVFGENLQEADIMTIQAKLNESIPIPYYVDVVAPKFLENQNLIDHIKRVGVVFHRKL